MNIFLLCLAAAGGFAACWFLKDIIVKAFTGTEAFVAKLEAKIAALKAAVRS